MSFNELSSLYLINLKVFEIYLFDHFGYRKITENVNLIKHIYCCLIMNS